MNLKYGDFTMILATPPLHGHLYFQVLFVPTNTAEVKILTFAFSFLDLHFYRIGSPKKS